MANKKANEYVPPKLISKAAGTWFQHDGKSLVQRMDDKPDGEILAYQDASGRITKAEKKPAAAPKPKPKEEG
jgi:hypothetical protein